MTTSRKRKAAEKLVDKPRLVPQDCYDRRCQVPRVLDDLDHLCDMDVVREYGYSRALQKFLEKRNLDFEALKTGAETWKRRQEQTQKELEASQSDVSDLKKIIADLTESLARAEGYMDRVLEDDAIARGLPSAHTPPETVQVPTPFRRGGPGFTSQAGTIRVSNRSVFDNDREQYATGGIVGGGFGSGDRTRVKPKHWFDK